MLSAGVGSRAGFLYQSIARDYKDTALLTAFCDTNKSRMEYAKSILTGIAANKAIATGQPVIIEELVKFKFK